MRTILCVALGGFLVAGCGSDPTGPPFQPVADVRQLMAEIIDPAADVVWDAVGTIIDRDEGTNEWFPQTDEEWMVVQNGALTIAEGGNLLMIGDRARDQDLWMRMAQGMIDAGMLAYEAAQARDKDAVFAIGETVYQSCDSCHNLYWVGDEDRGRVRDETPLPPSD